MDECSDAAILSDVFLVADILITVVDREIEVSSAAPKVVEVRDGCPSIVGEFRRVGVVQPFHKLVDQVDELGVPVSGKKLIANSNDLVLQLVRSPLVTVIVGRLLWGCCKRFGMPSQFISTPVTVIVPLFTVQHRSGKTLRRKTKLW